MDSAFSPVKDVQAFDHLSVGGSVKASSLLVINQISIHTQENKFYSAAIIMLYYLHLVHTVQYQKPLRRAPAAITWDPKYV